VPPAPHHWNPRAGPPGARPPGPPPARLPDDGPCGVVPDLASAVLDVVDLIPAGQVATYGDIAAYLSGEGLRCGPRQVGSVMARWGGAVAWWRVLSADGSPPSGHEAEALARYRQEGTPLRRDGRRVDLARARLCGPRPR